VNDHYFSEVSRPVQIMVGVILGVAGLLCFAIVVAACVLAATPRADRTNSAIVGSLFLLFGAPATVFAVRLISGRGRRGDGGLIGSIVLRVSGVGLLLFPLISLLQGSWDWLLGLVHIGASGACFSLAAYRERLRFHSPPGPTLPP
jgi:hypothetical protein